MEWGATYLGWTDRESYTVIKVAKNGRRIVVQEDLATRTDTNGMSESQTYTYTPNPEGVKRTLSLRKNGEWREVKTNSRFSIGERHKYHDFSF